MKQYLKEYAPTYYRENKSKMDRRALAATRRRVAVRRSVVSQFKESTPCVDCGNFAPACVMDFDHLERSAKLAGIATLVNAGATWERIFDEVAKCELVCARCHRLRTYHGDTVYRPRQWRRHRAVLDDLKSTTPCFDCGEVFRPCQMDFDHTLEGKVVNVARLVGAATEILKAEIQKCQIVCANCHRIRTSTGSRIKGASQNLVARIEELLARTPLPDDERYVPFPSPELLGVVPDKELSQMTGVSRGMVAWYRRKAGYTMNCRGERVAK